MSLDWYWKGNLSKVILISGDFCHDEMTLLYLFPVKVVLKGSDVEGKDLLGKKSEGKKSGLNKEKKIYNTFLSTSDMKMDRFHI